MALLESKSDDFTHVEDDIPDAKLQELVKQCNVAFLRRWLSCRDAKVTAK